MTINREQSEALKNWLEESRNFAISHFRPGASGPEWGSDEVITDWIYRPTSARLAYAQCDADRAHVFMVEEMEPDVDGWMLVTDGGDRVSLQPLDSVQAEIAASWRARRPDPEWSWPLRSILGDVAGEEPTS